MGKAFELTIKARLVCEKQTPISDVFLKAALLKRGIRGKNEIGQKTWSYLTLIRRKVWAW